MVPASFDESNRVLGKPPDMTCDECEALSVFSGQSADGKPVVISCWKLTKDELDLINNTGRVWLWVFGVTMPPCALEAINPFRPLTTEPISPQKE